MKEKGVRAQCLLWVSTSNKNPNYRDVKYIEPLIATNTVNTVPPKTIDAYRDRGNPKLILEKKIRTVKQILTNLPEFGIDINKITQQPGT